ncbi:hypothetical protein H1C71_005849, partial [Ictidomys tridecemlineatus]
PDLHGSQVPRIGRSPFCHQQNHSGAQARPRSSFTHWQTPTGAQAWPRSASLTSVEARAQGRPKSITPLTQARWSSGLLRTHILELKPGPDPPHPPVQEP